MSKARKIGSFGKSTTNIKKAILYCRVSSDRQKTEGHGLENQEQRCRVYAMEKGYEVVEVFRDSFTGGGDYMQRPAMSELLDFVSSNAHTEFVIIFDDLKRLARDTVSHWQLRQHISKLGATVESPNFEFKEDDDSSWMHEAINAVFNENERRTNRRQVIQKQKARLESGCWAFGAKRGYKMIKDPIHGKILTAFEPDASFLGEAVEGFANGRFLHKVDACEFLVNKGFWKKQKPERYIDKFTLILQDPLYAGYIEYPMWEVSRRKGHHKGIITLEVFEAVQRRLNQDDKGKRVRIDVSETFPLRGLLVCDACEKPLTGAISSGRSAKYPYYLCQDKECEFGRMSIRADDVHKGFEEIISKQGLKGNIGEVVKEIFDRAWNDEVGSLKESDSSARISIEELNKKIRQVTDLAVNAKNEKVRDVYEKQIEEYAEEIASLESHSIKNLDIDIPYRTALEKATTLLKSPYKIWNSVDVREQQKLFFFIFDERLAYSKKAGYRTDKLPSATRIFEDFVTSNSQDVEMAGIEPASELVTHGASTVRSHFFNLKHLS